MAQEEGETLKYSSHVINNIIQEERKGENAQETKETAQGAA